MKRRYFTVGPAAIYPGVSTWSNQFFEKGLGSVSHRSIDFEKMYQHLDEQLRKLMNVPDSHSIFIASSGSDIMERILQNCVLKQSYHFVNGSFSDKFYKYAKRIGIDALKQEIEYGCSFKDIPQIPADVELICLTHNETSTGIKTSEDYIHNIAIENKEKIIVVDVVSSAPLVNLDFSLVDICFFSSQKAFGLPAGLGIWIMKTELAETISQRAFNKGRGAHNTVGDYIKSYSSFQTPSTPNILGVYLMGKVAEDLNRMGTAKLISNMLKKKNLLHDLFSNNPYLRLANSSSNSSDTVIVTEYLSDKTVVCELLESNNVIPSAGYGQFKDVQLRFANFPANTLEDIEYLFKVLA